MGSDEHPCGRHVRCGAQLRRTERIGAVTTSTLSRRSPAKYGRGWCRRNLSSQWWGHRAAPLVVRNSDALTTQVMLGHGKWVGMTRATSGGGQIRQVGDQALGLGLLAGAPVPSLLLKVAR